MITDLDGAVISQKTSMLNYVALDTFNTPPNGDLNGKSLEKGGLWLTPGGGGTFNKTTGEVAKTTANFVHGIAITDTALNDGIDMELKIFDGLSCGICFGAFDLSNYWSFLMAASTSFFFNRIGGTFFQQGPSFLSPDPSGVTRTVKVTIRGSIITAYIDGSLIGSFPSYSGTATNQGFSLFGTAAMVSESSVQQV